MVEDSIEIKAEAGKKRPFEYRLSSLKISTVCYILGLLWTYRVGCLSYIVHGSGVIWYAIGSFVLLLALFIYVRGEVKLNRAHALLLLFCVSLAFSSWLGGTAFSTYVDEVFKILVLVFTVDIGYKCGGKSFFKAAYCISAFFLTVNTFSAIVFPHSPFRDASGAASIFFLGADNSLIVRYMLGVFFQLMYKLKGNDVFAVPLYSLVNLALFAFLRDIATGKMMAFVLFALLLLAKYWKGFRFPVSVAAVINVAFFLVVVIGQSTLNWADSIFELLGRNSDFTHRAYLWQFAFILIQQHPLFGIGCFTDTYFNRLIETLTLSGLFNTGNPHNTYLTILLSGGLVAFILFSALVALACGGERGRSSVVIALSSVFLFAFMLHAQVEGRDASYIIAMALMLFNLKDDFGLRNRAASVEGSTVGTSDAGTANREIRNASRE